MKDTFFVSFIAGPGAGKSTLAAGLFAELKFRGYDAELVTEYAKEIVWEDRLDVLKDQWHLFDEQLKRLKRLKGKVDFAITDSPVILSLAYNKAMDARIAKHVVKSHNDHSKLNVFVQRHDGYNSNGRTQNREQASILDSDIQVFLTELHIPYIVRRSTRKSMVELADIAIAQSGHVVVQQPRDDE